MASIPISAYTDLISLARAKLYLRIDDSMNEDDDEIVSMINSAFLFMERYTNHIFMPKNFGQFVPPRIYNYPIISIDGVEEEDLSNFYQRNLDQLCGGATRPVWTEYVAGYKETGDVPEDFLQAALQIIKVWYYESEKQANSTLIPISVTQVLDTYRRFV